MTIQVVSFDKVTEEPKQDAVDPKEPVAKETTSEPGDESSEQNESTESETVETEESNSETSEDAETQEETEAKDNSTEKPATKKKSGFQRRIDKLNAAKSAAMQEVEYWKREALKNSATDHAAQAKADTAKPATAEGEPNADRFDTHAEYVKALAKWEAKQLFNEERQNAEKSRMESEQAKLVKTYVERKEAFAATVEDYDEVISGVDDIQISPAVQGIILESEDGPKLAYELAKDREECARICKLSPLAAAREMGKLEARIAADTPAKQELKKTTKAPKPIEPVLKGSSGSVKKAIDDPSLSQSEYEVRRREQLKRKQAG